jgi:hypothetical protein
MKYVPSHVPEKNVNYMWTTNSFTCEVRIQNKALFGRAPSGSTKAAPPPVALL